MAFVPAPGASFGAKSFMGTSVSSTTIPRVASIRMATDTDTDAPKESSVFGKAGKSQWKENLFTGGFPGGEQFFKQWAEDGMKGDVPDMPESMQAKSKYMPKAVKKKGLLSKLDATEFFKEFIGQKTDDKDEVEGEDAEPVTGDTVAEDEEPNESLYAPYFPAATRNLAPDINIVYEKSFEKDRVYMAMTEVSASPTDVYYPKEMKGKAPIIEMSYNGNLSTASISLRLDDVEGLPTLPPPPKKGDAVTTLVPGSGGGLKLNIEVEGE